eukprot:CAMPEP_0177664266 /NCGR_PEP_ID=MMETSP0447-20121125/20392_1 /TAXON_ID=0 /ORGANISM="Stygamoeba regulata, Strain BSH-02190019" /LENGTH=450 /DNA_ID=CAMNT_0019170207 /DNA_START=237 /DNA_END=1589 /DNA_ORIENTATION=+
MSFPAFVRHPPQLIFLKQESLAREKYAKEGREREVHVVVKNAQLALVNDPNTPHAYDVRNCIFETELCYDHDGLSGVGKPVTYLKTPPIRCKVTVKDPVGGVVQLQLRLAALTSQHEDSFFCVHVYVLDGPAGSRIPGVRLISEPIKTVSKVDQIRAVRKQRNKRKRREQQAGSSALSSPVSGWGAGGGTVPQQQQHRDEPQVTLNHLGTQLTRVETILLEQQALIKQFTERAAAAGSASFSSSSSPSSSSSAGSTSQKRTRHNQNHSGISASSAASSASAASSSLSTSMDLAVGALDGSMPPPPDSYTASPSLALYSGGLTSSTAAAANSSSSSSSSGGVVELGSCFTALLEAFRRTPASDRPMAVRRIAKSTKPHDAGLVNEMLDMLRVEGSFIAPTQAPPILENHLPHHAHMHAPHSSLMSFRDPGLLMESDFAVDDLYAELLNATQ